MIERTPRSTQTCVILAGGLGTRLRSVIQDQPKALAPVGDRTFLQVQMDRLVEAGVTDLVLSLGYRAELIVQAVTECPPSAPVRFVVEPQLLGTGGAITHALDSLGLDEVIVANGDTFLGGNLSSMFVRLDRGAGELFRMAAVSVPDRKRFGGVVGDLSGRVIGFLEKGQTGAGLINAGLYRICRAALPMSRAGAYSLEIEILPSLVENGKATLATIDGTFTDIGVPDDYRRFCEEHGC